MCRQEGWKADLAGTRMRREPVLGTAAKRSKHASQTHCASKQCQNKPLVMVWAWCRKGTPKTFEIKFCFGLFQKAKIWFLFAFAGLQGKTQWQPGPIQPQQQTQHSGQQPAQIRRRITKKSVKTKRVRDSSSPSGHQGNHLPLTQDQISANHQEAQSEEELLSRSHSSGMVSGRSSALFSRSEELKQVGPQGHDAYDPVPLSHLNQEERRSITE